MLGCGIGGDAIGAQLDHPGPRQHPPPEASVARVCNPHNLTGQLWSRASLEVMLDRHALLICDEAFLPLVPG